MHQWQVWGPQIVWKILSDEKWLMVPNKYGILSDKLWVTEIEWWKILVQTGSNWWRKVGFCFCCWDFKPKSSRPILTLISWWNWTLFLGYSVLLRRNSHRAYFFSSWVLSQNPRNFESYAKLAPIMFVVPGNLVI